MTRGGGFAASSVPSEVLVNKREIETESEARRCLASVQASGM